MNKKTITNTKELIEALNINLSENEILQTDNFFKKKVMHFSENKIVYPKIEEIKRKIKEINLEIEKVLLKYNYWNKNKNKLVRNKTLSPFTIYFKKNFWRHKLKEITNKEYKQDVKDTKLNDQILLDPEYHNLFETFLVNPDYRKKLKETINTSIVYRYNQIGDYSKKKKEFKIKTSNMKIDQIKQNLDQLKKKKEIFLTIYKIIKKTY
jgi:hypothetical protein